MTVIFELPFQLSASESDNVSSEILTSTVLVSAVAENINVSSSTSLAVRTIFIIASSSMVILDMTANTGGSFTATTVNVKVVVSASVPSVA